MPRAPKRSDRTPDSLLEKLVARIDARVPGTPAPDTLPTGFPSLDRVLGGGVRRGDLLALGGAVGSGKSALALGIAIRAAAAGIPTLYVSGEMSPERLLERTLAIEGRASIDELRQAQLDDAARAAVGAAALRLRDHPLMVRPLLGADPQEIPAALDLIPARQLVVVDSLQAVAPHRPVNRAEERVALAIRGLKSLAVERDLAVLATTQLSRHRGGRPDPRPTLEDLGGLGAIKQDADVVLMIYREEMYRPGQGVEGATELIVSKNRNGPTGFVDLYFYPRWLRFVDMLDTD
jgi:replicative DNA helicase